MSGALENLSAVFKDTVSFILYVTFYFWREKHPIVLLYHSIGHVDPRDDPYKLNVSVKDFQDHLRIISGSKDRITVTFDDGYGNNFENAFPLLKKYGMKAVFFIATDFIEGKYDSRKLGGKDFDLRPMSWDEIKTMDRDNMEIGSHGVGHLLLKGLPADALEKEAGGSKAVIEHILGHNITSFAYPYGSAKSFDKTAEEIMASCGYKKAYANTMGAENAETDPFKINRVRIYTEDRGLRFRMKIAGAYNWVDAFIEAAFVGAGKAVKI